MTTDDTAPEPAVRGPRVLMTREEYTSWVRSLPPGICTFCQWEQYQIVIAQTRHWLWILNRAPYWRFHTMLMPKKHHTQMSELSVVEVGELFRIYEIAVSTLRKVQHHVPKEERADDYLFFWRLRSQEPSVRDGHQNARLSHFHMHLAPDREGLFDPLLSSEAHTIDYIPLLNIASTSTGNYVD